MSSDSDATLPVHLLIDAVLRPLNALGIFYYIHQRGEKNSGVILLKINGLSGKCHILVQQRNLENVIEWISAMKDHEINEEDADAFIKRSILRDPDLWVIEIEDRDMNNPFDRV